MLINYILNLNECISVYGGVWSCGVSDVAKYPLRRFSATRNYWSLCGVKCDTASYSIERLSLEKRTKQHKGPSRNLNWMYGWGIKSSANFKNTEWCTCVIRTKNSNSTCHHWLSNATSLKPPGRKYLPALPLTPNDVITTNAPIRSTMLSGHVSAPATPRPWDVHETIDFETSFFKLKAFLRERDCYEICVRNNKQK